MAEDAEDRTEAPSQRRLQRAREQGQVAVSREVPLLAGLAASLAVLMMGAEPILHHFAVGLRGFIAGGFGWDVERNGVAALRAALMLAMLAAAPLVLACLFAGVAAGFAQTGGVMNPKALQPGLGRLNPKRGLKRLLGSEGLVEGGRSLAKLAVLSWAVWHVLGTDLPELRRAFGWSTGLLLDRILRDIIHLATSVVAAHAAIAGLDFVWTRFRHARSLRMSREEVREEMKETEGNPHVKGRLRQLRMSRARRRMMAAVPKATAVVTNPTHYAVALAYERGTNAAPKVVAKGVDELAARIRALAEEHRIPIVPNPPLARALYRVELDAEIPAEHFQAVAEIIAYVWRLKERVRRR